MKVEYVAPCAAAVGLNPATASLGFTVGKQYEVIETKAGSYVLRDDQDFCRVRPMEEFRVPMVRRAWARFPSLQSIFGG